MEQFYLEKVTKIRKIEIIEYIKEFYENNSKINGVGRLQDYVTQEKEEFDKWYEKIKKEENDELPKMCYLLIRKKDNKLIGMSNIRMTQNLKDYKYGHIGYSIRPTERNKGYGTIQFYITLKELQKNNIKECIMNCEKGNQKSKSIIKSLGGILKSTNNQEEYYTINIEKSIEKNTEKYGKYEYKN